MFTTEKVGSIDQPMCQYNHRERSENLTLPELSGFGCLPRKAATMAGTNAAQKKGAAPRALERKQHHKRRESSEN
jgi:hypothetical protein